MSKSSLSTVLLTSVGAALAFAAPAPAQMMEKFSTEVGYSDLNLTTSAGVAQLQRRISNAARHSCGGRVDSRNVKAFQAAEKCRRGVIASAAPKVELAVAKARAGQALAANAAIGSGGAH